jgi:hypothetical protein
MKHIRISLSDANAFVKRHHRHHGPVVGHLFSLGAVDDGKLVGVVIVGRPTSRHRDDGLTAEVTRLCTDGTRNACSFLYGAGARAAFALGFQRIGTYILASENGASIKASNCSSKGAALSPRPDPAATAVDSAMKALGKNYTSTNYDGATHGFMRSQDDPKATRDLAEEAANLAATKGAWPRTVEFLRRNLGAK